MHLRYPVHNWQLFFRFIHFETGMFSILTVFLHNIFCRPLNLFISNVSSTYVTDFLKDNFNVIPFADDCNVIASFINGNEDEFIMKQFKIVNNFWSFQNWIQFLIFEFSTKQSDFTVNLIKDFSFPRLHTLLSQIRIKSSEFRRADI